MTTTLIKNHYFHVCEGGKKRSTRKFQQKEKGRNLSAKAEDATELFDVPVHFEFEPKNEN